MQLNPFFIFVRVNLRFEVKDRGLIATRVTLETFIRVKALNT